MQNSAQGSRTSACEHASPVRSKAADAAPTTIDASSNMLFHDQVNCVMNSPAVSDKPLKELEMNATAAAVAAENLLQQRNAKDVVDAKDTSVEGRNDGCYEVADEDEDMDELAAVGNGCGEAVSPPSSCADAFLLAPSLAATAKPAEWSLQSFSPTTTPCAASAATGDDVLPHTDLPAQPTDVKSTRLAAPPATKAKVQLQSFTARAMQVITHNAASHAERENAVACAPNGTSAMVDHHDNAAPAVAAAPGRVVGDVDPMGVRHLYSLPHSLAGSCVSISSTARRATGTAASAPVATTAEITNVNAMTATSPFKTDTDAFSMERFAVFYEVALEELISECEQRVANAPASWRDGQRRFIRGDSNYDLATSTLSFDSPRSSGVSLVTGHTPQFGSTASSAYPPCYLNAMHNTHGLNTRQMSGGAYAGMRALPPPPPPPLALPTRNFFSTGGQARQAELEEVVTEETVPALLAALGRHHGKMAPIVFIAALAYLARVTVHCASEFLSFTRANWYRMTTTAILIAAKVYDEHSSTRLNAHFARSSGIPLSDMTKLEVNFLYLIDFDLLLKEAEVEQWLTWMETLAVRRDVMTPLQAYFVHSSDSSSGVAASAVAVPAAVGERPCTFSLPSTSLCSATLPNAPAEKSRTTTAEASRTEELSSEGPVTDSVAITSPFSAPLSRTFTHVRVASNTVFITKDTVSMNPAPSHRLTDTTEVGASSAAIPLREFRSPTSSLVMPRSLLGAPRSTLSGASLPGSVTSPLTCLRAAGGIPPSPIHGVLPMCPPPLQTRLFSVVHGKRELSSPRSMCQLGRLASSPPSPLEPPSMEPNSPVGFFKQPHGGSHAYPHHQQHMHRHSAPTSAAAAATGHGLCDTDLMATALSSSTAAGRSTGFAFSSQKPPVSNATHAPRQPPTTLRRGTSSYTGDSAGAAVATVGGKALTMVAAVHASRSASSNPPVATTATPFTSSGSGTRWGPFDMVQQVRDVLGVTASLVRGQLNVLAPAKAPEELKRPPSRAVVSDGALHHTATRGSQEMADEPHRSNSSTTVFRDPFASAAGNNDRKSAPAECTTTTATASLPPHNPERYGRRQYHYHALSPGQESNSSRTRSQMVRAGEAPSSYRGSAGPAGHVASSAGPAGGEEEEGEYYDEDEEGVYDEEDADAYGYYDEDGYYYAYDDEGEYDYDEEGEWYEEEEDAEAEAEYFQRCRPPLTHSPPSL
jgi:hypothetical protein